MLGPSLRSALFIVLLLSPTLCIAGGILFVEVEANPEGADRGREWVRIKNDTGSTLYLTQFTFSENGTRHAIRALGEAGVPHGSYAIIADNAETYQAEHSQSNEYVFDSTFSLNNSGETLRLEDPSGHVVAEISYTGQRTSSSKKSPSRVIAAASEPSGNQRGEGRVLPWVFAVACVASVGALALPRVTTRPTRGYTIIDIS